MLAVLYDIHGNTAALDSVLAEAEAAGADRFLLGGDLAVPSADPLAAIQRLRALPDATWIRGNTERWLREPSENPEIRPVFAAMAEKLGAEEADRLYALPTEAELDGVLYVHGSPISDIESFAPGPSDDDERLLGGVRDRTVVFGHSHQQFRRPGPGDTELVNPGSVGMPLDGDVRAAWATWDGDFTLRRTEYDVERAAAAYRSVGGEFGEMAARRVERGSD